MDDRTMLELAAKAAGVDWMPATTEKGIELEPVFGLWLRIHGEPSEHQRRRWNPLTDDGDALRLVVAIGFSDEEGVSIFLADKEDPTVVVRKGRKAGAMELAVNDPYAATRRAITRAAAAIQLAKESGK